MKRIELEQLIDKETRRMITEAITAEERTQLKELGAKLATWADKNYQKDVRQWKDDREMRDMAEEDYRDYLKIADFLKNGNEKAASSKFYDMDTAAREAIPDGIFNVLDAIEDKENSKADLKDGLAMFQNDFKNVLAKIDAGKWKEAKKAWDSLIDIGAEDVTDALSDLEGY